MEMVINRHNYEEMLIDFLEGKLSETEQVDLFLFLDANPDIKEEFDSLRIEIPTVSSVVTIDYPLKETLIKRPVGAEYIDEFTWLCIARLEGDATPAERKALHRLLKENPSLSADWVLFEKTKLIPADNVTFGLKSQLTHHRVGASFMIHRYAVAASIAALMVLVSIPTGNQLYNKQQFSYSNQKPAFIGNKPAVMTPIAPKTSMASVGKSTNNISTIVAKEPVVSVLDESTVNLNVSIEEPVQQLAALTPIEASVKITLDERMELNTPSRETRLINMNPAENPSRYLSVGAFLAEKVVEKSGIDPNFIASSPRAKFWQLAQAGVKGVSHILGIPVKIDKVYDNEGNLKKISIDSKLLAVSRNF